MRYCEACGAAFRFARTCPKDASPTTAGAFDPLVGRVLGDRYRILDRIGAGGMGQVYRAAHTRIACVFAVKVVWGDFAYDPSMHTRFVREAEVASCLQSRHIVRVIDFAEEEGTLPYLVMEYLEGPTLFDLVARGGPLAPDRAARIATQIARGLAHAHERGVVHRDLKPENVVLVREEDERDVAKILDFGVARLRDDDRLTGFGVSVGTPLYMAPEQLSAADVDGRADLYALGIVMFEMLTGKPPFQANSLQDLTRLHFQEPPPSLRSKLREAGSGAGLDDVVQRLLAKSANDRYGTAKETIEAIQRAMTVSAPARAPVAPSPVAPSTIASSSGAPSANPSSFVPPSVVPSGVSPSGPGSLGGPAPTRSSPASPPIQVQLERAILHGAPRYNAGDHAGCYGVYRATAEQILRSGAALAPAIAARLTQGLERAASRANPMDAAWDMRYAFDDILASRIPAPSPPPASSARSAAAASSQNVAEEIRETLIRAIGVGAPAYDRGQPDVCERIYRQAALAIVGRVDRRGQDATMLLPPPVGIALVNEALREAVGKPPEEAAWVFRRAFDAVLASF